jgi:hypothetical protein
MINAQELRLGNLMIDKLTGSTLKVSGLELTDGKHKIFFDVIDRSKFPLPEGWQAKSIPLTPEILGKAGFVEEDRVYKKGNVRLVRKRDGAFGQHRFELQSDEFTPDLEYLHQLQNLCFALNNEELNVLL